LPADVSGFVGRLAYLKRLDELLGRESDAVSIALLTGMGGLGKTALAVHWGHQVVERFPDGQLYLNLRGFDPSGRAVRPADAMRVVIETLGFAPDRIPADVDALAALYRSLLADRRILVILDNARDAGQVRLLLPGSAPAFVVVTSRDRLTALVVGEGAHPLRLEPLSPGESRDLLTRRLGADRVTAEPAAVEAVVAGCAGLPLALAVAAARVQETGFPLATVAAGLDLTDQRLDALDPGGEGSQVRAVFSWSYEALAGPTGRLFRLLGLHPGPGVSAAAAASLAGLTEAETRVRFGELTRAHLLTEHSPGRYHSHDLVHAYAGELGRSLDSYAERREALARLVDHYTCTAYAADRLIHPARDPIRLPMDLPMPGVTTEYLADATRAMDWLSVEHPVLIAVLRQAADGGLARRAWQLAWSLETFLARRGHWHDLATAWAAAQAAVARSGDGPAEAYARRCRAGAELRLGRYADAVEHLDIALTLYEGTNDPTGHALTHRSMAYLQATQRRYDLALFHVEQAITLFRGAGHRRGEAGALNNLGWYRAQLGDHAGAVACIREALLLYEAFGDENGLAHTWDSLGFAYHGLGDHERAMDCYQQALARYRHLGDRYEEAGTLTRLGDTLRGIADRDGAHAAWHRAHEILTQLRHPDADAVGARLLHRL
jgi:tetratricopeptide (TPR) repeat protein